MNKYKLHSLITSAKTILEDENSKKEDFKKIFQIMADELKDPFASQIDEFLADKSKKEAEKNKPVEDAPEEDSENSEDSVGMSDSEHPQNDAIETLKDESVDYKEPVEQDHPQEDAIDTLKDEAVDYKEPIEQDHPQEDAIEKVIDEIKDDKTEKAEEKEKGFDEDQKDIVDKKDEELEKARSKQDELQKQIEELNNKRESGVESSLRKLGNEIARRGYVKLANTFIIASSVGIIEILNNLLMKEFLLRDILENYCYLFDSSLATEAMKYKPKESILFLQKQILSFGGKPTTQRYVIPAINPGNAGGIVELVKEHTVKLVSDYNAAVASIEHEEKYFTLKIMLQKITQQKTTLL